MKDKFDLIINDKLARVAIFVSMFFLVPSIALIIFFYEKLPPVIPLFNSMPWGEERLFSSRINIFFPLILIGVFIANIFCSAFVYKKHVLAARLLMLNSLLFFMLSFLAYVQILFLTF